MSHEDILNFRNTSNVKASYVAPKVQPSASALKAIAGITKQLSGKLVKAIAGEKAAPSAKSAETTAPTAADPSKAATTTKNSSQYLAVSAAAAGLGLVTMF